MRTYPMHTIPPPPLTCEKFAVVRWLLRDAARALCGIACIPKLRVLATHGAADNVPATHPAVDFLLVYCYFQFLPVFCDFYHLA